MVEWKQMWELTAWDKKFQGVDKFMQSKIIPYTYLLAKDLFALAVPKGDIKLLSTGVQEGWTTEELAGDYLSEGEVVTIPWGKSPGAQNPVKYYNGKFVTGDNRIATSLDTNVLDNKFLYYWMYSKSDIIETFYRGAGIQHPSMFKVLTMPVPLLSISEQRRIVGILDTFTSSIENLKEQIAQRRKQYEYYRDQLLDLEGKEGVEMKEMWEVTAWDKRFQGVDKFMQSKIIPYTYLLAKDLFALAVPKGDIKLLSTGVQEGWTTEELAGDYLSEGEVVTIPWGKSPGAQNPVKYYNGKFVTGDNRIATSLDTNVLDNKFLYYWMYSKSDIIETFYRGAGIQHPSMFKILTMKVSIPHISEQQRIVSILDTFEASIQNLENQLKEREKQYEYYRNKLLTFEE